MSCMYSSERTYNLATVFSPSLPLPSSSPSLPPSLSLSLSLSLPPSPSLPPSLSLPLSLIIVHVSCLPSLLKSSWETWWGLMCLWTRMVPPSFTPTQTCLALRTSSWVGELYSPVDTHCYFGIGNQNEAWVVYTGGVHVVTAMTWEWGISTYHKGDMGRSLNMPFLIARLYSEIGDTTEACTYLRKGEGCRPLASRVMHDIRAF